MVARNQFHIKPRSKKDRSLPYTYEGWVDILAGQGTEPVYDHYFSDTLCGLVEVLEQEEIQPDHVKLFGLFRGEHTELDTDLCTDEPADKRGKDKGYFHSLRSSLFHAYKHLK